MSQDILYTMYEKMESRMKRWTGEGRASWGQISEIVYRAAKVEITRNYLGVTM